MSEELIEKSFEVNGAAVVRIANVNGKITVRPGADGQVAVQAKKHGNGNAPVEIYQDEDGSVHVLSQPKKSNWGIVDFSMNRHKVDFDLTVPVNTHLTVKAVNSDAQVEGLRGECTIGTVNGAIDITDLSGTLKLDTVNGKIMGSRLTGDTSAKTVNGKIVLAESDMPSLTANTVNGSIKLETPLGAGPYHLKTVSGNVKISTQDALNGVVAFKSMSGKLRVNDKSIRSGGFVDHGPRSKVFTFGDGGTEFIFKSVSGNLHIFSGDEPEVLVSADVRQPKAERAVKPDLMSVLDKISSGELSVDEGLEALENA